MSPATQMADRCLVFVSYSHVDEKPHLDSFLEMLSRALEQQIQRGRRSAYTNTVWHDRGSTGTRPNIQPGSLWSDELEKRIATCAVFLGFLSPNYVGSEETRREWDAFADRLARSEQPALARKLQIPLMWRTVEIPDWVTANQVQFCPDEGQKAFFDVILDSRGFREEAVERLAYKLGSIIKDAYDEFPGGPVARAPSGGMLFTGVPPGNPAPASAGNRRPRVEFLVAVASKDEVRSVFPGMREQTEFYGDTYEDWKPYLLDDDFDSDIRDLVMDIMADIARETRTTKNGPGLSYGPYDQVGPDSPRKANDALENNRVFVFLVDPWSVTLERYKAPLAELDRLRTPTTAIMIPRNAEDDETRRNERFLNQKVGEVLRRIVAERHATLFPANLHSYQRFAEALRKAVASALGALMGGGTPPPPPPGGFEVNGGMENNSGG